MAVTVLLHAGTTPCVGNGNRSVDEPRRRWGVSSRWVAALRSGCYAFVGASSLPSVHVSLRSFSTPFLCHPFLPATTNNNNRTASPPPQMIDPLADSLHTLQWTLGAAAEEYGDTHGFVPALRSALGHPMLPVCGLSRRLLSLVILCLCLCAFLELFIIYIIACAGGVPTVHRGSQVKITSSPARYVVTFDSIDFAVGLTVLA